MIGWINWSVLGQLQMIGFEQCTETASRELDLDAIAANFDAVGQRCDDRSGSLRRLTQLLGNLTAAID